MGMNNFDAVMAHRKGTLHLVAVAQAFDEPGVFPRQQLLHRGRL